MIKEIPILVSTGLIPPVMAGIKTMTRRTKGLDTINADRSDWQLEWAEPLRNIWTFTQKSTVNEQSLQDKTFNQVQLKCPYGRPGDILWVRENFRINSWVPDDAELTFRYEADGVVSPLIVVDTDETDSEKFNKYWKQSCDDLYKAGYEPNDQDRFRDYDYKALRLRPNIFLPKPAARIWLQVESVRVERLQDISPLDAKLEGIEPIEFSGAMLGWRNYLDQKNICKKATDSFKSLWESINGADSWQANPWLWVINYSVLSTTGKPDLQLINK